MHAQHHILAQKPQRNTMPHFIQKPPPMHYSPEPMVMMAPHPFSAQEVFYF